MFADETPLTYTESKNPFDTSAAEPITTTNKDYDLGKIRETLQQMLLTVGIMSYLHFQFGYLRPVVLQVVFGLRTLSVSPLFRVYILKRETTGDLARPWKNNMFAGAAPPPPTPKELKAQEKKAAKKKLNKDN
ncbi:hypothetical protein HDU97_003232 [Phlyctochytrium planicorne]|nr:hypothetical protein HDU97_003232 [Phlyctochytrium planicorne]